MTTGSLAGTRTDNDASPTPIGDPYRAARGWACFYEQQNSSATLAFVYDEDYNSLAIGTYGTRMYWTATNANFVDGVWAIRAP